MSDLISTPSHTPSTVSNEAFETLIDLLASDGIDEHTSPPLENGPRAPANATLRDPSGKLDFDKIRSMFAAQRGSSAQRASSAPHPLGEEKDRVRSPAGPHEEGESDEEHHSHRSASTVASRSNSMSPRPVARAGAGHRRSSTFGNQPWAAIHENAGEAKVAEVSPTPSQQPLSLDELNAALAGARGEVRALRQQYDDLQALVSKRLGAEIRDRAKVAPGTVNSEKGVVHKEKPQVDTHAAGSQAARSAGVPSDLPTEIATLSEDEAKRVLNSLVRSLNFSLDAMGSMAVPPPASPTSPQNLSLLIPTRQHDVASITRAVKFLGTVDELVWRRSSAPSGPRTLLPVYSEENVVALTARLELWERAVRRSSKA